MQHGAEYGQQLQDGSL